LSSILQDRHRLLVTILFGNNLVNVFAVSLTTILILNFFDKNYAIYIDWVGMTFILLIVGEVTPKLYAIRKSEILALKVAQFLRIIIYLFYPITFLLLHLSHFFSSLIRTKKEFRLTHSDFITMIEMGKKQGFFKSMPSDVLSISQKRVKEVMTPRTDMRCLDSILKIRQAKKGIVHSRTPVYKDSIDNIVGILYAKDILESKKHDTPVKEITREPYFIPEGKRVSELLKDFLKRKVHIAVVVDEFGGTSGVVTLEDLLEEFVGEIRDEFDREHPVFIRQDKAYIVDPIIELKHLSGLLNVYLPFEEFDTLSGFLFSLAKKVPLEGDSFEFENLRFTIEEVIENRIEKVIIERI